MVVIYISWEPLSVDNAYSLYIHWVRFAYGLIIISEIMGCLVICFEYCWAFGVSLPCVVVVTAYA